MDLAHRGRHTTAELQGAVSQWVPCKLRMCTCGCKHAGADAYLPACLPAGLCSILPYCSWIHVCLQASARMVLALAHKYGVRKVLDSYAMHARGLAPELTSAKEVILWMDCLRSVPQEGLDASHPTMQALLRRLRELLMTTVQASQDIKDLMMPKRSSSRSRSRPELLAAHDQCALDSEVAMLVTRVLLSNLRVHECKACGTKIALASCERNGHSKAPMQCTICGRPSSTHFVPEDFEEPEELPGPGEVEATHHFNQPVAGPAY